MLKTVKILKVTKISDYAILVFFSKEDIGSYNPGQYVSIETTINNKKERRAYSLASYHKVDTEPFVCIKKVKNGIFSNFALKNFKSGFSVELLLPQGVFYPKKDDEIKKNTIILIAAGSGITPILSIIKHLTNKKVILIYSNKKQEETLFYDELKELDKKNVNFTLIEVYTRVKKSFFSNNVLKSRLSGSNLIKILKNNEIEIHESEFFICGPEQLTFSITKTLTNKGVKSKNIRKELFGSVKENSIEKTIDVQQKTVAIILNEKKYLIKINSNTNILDAAIENGLDVPFSCKGGVCSSCIAKLKEGEVSYKDSFGISEDELKEGWRLMCISKPKTEKVLVNFDE